MLSAFEQKTTIGERILRRSMREPSEDLTAAEESLLPTNNSSAMNCISQALSST